MKKKVLVHKCKGKMCGCCGDCTYFNHSAYEDTDYGWCNTTNDRHNEYDSACSYYFSKY